MLAQQLSDLDRQLSEAERLAKAALKSVHDLRRAAAQGQLAAIDRQFEQAPRQLDQARTALAEARAGFSYDAAAEMASGAYTAELREAAAAQGVVIVERDGRLTAFPLLLRLEPRTAAVRIGSRMERRLNPPLLADVLRKAQASQGFRPAAVLDRLFAAYARLAPALQPGWRDTTPGPGPIVPLLDLHAVLTLLPEAEAAYPREAFACDLLRLNRAPDTLTRGGHRFVLSASTATKGRNLLRVYDERGDESVFAGISFAPAPG
jgi:hypothetical protein